MLRQLHLLTFPIAISIAFYDAGFFVAANIFSLTGREVFLGVAAGVIVGTCVLTAALWKRASIYKSALPKHAKRCGA
jgi:hypothetical protein